MRKCEHGVYWPEDQLVAEYCQTCNPATNDLSKPDKKEFPRFNRRGSLSMTETGKLPKCPVCAENGISSILTVSTGGICSVCHSEFVIQAPHNLRANNKQPGVCPECGSGVHFDEGGRKWRCADCSNVYRAPKRIS